jgi:uncharacterized protein (DUF305 family)
MENNKVATLLVVLIIGLGAGYYWGGSKAQVPLANQHMMSDGSMMHDTGMSMGDAMDDMMAGLSGKTGDEFDKAFLSEMIMHHEGAVAMAQVALRDAKHQEIKNMANDIISAQTQEISQMRIWLKNWYNQ